MKYLQSDTGQARVFLYDADDERIMTFDCAFVDGDCAVPAQQTTTIRGLDGKVLRIYNQPFGGAWNWERDCSRPMSRNSHSISSRLFRAMPRISSTSFGLIRTRSPTVEMPASASR
jgi:hypothetical protein